MFTRCRSRSAAEEIKVKQKRGASQRTRKYREGNKEGEGGEEGGSCTSRCVCVVRNAQCQGCSVRRGEVCNLMLSCMMPLHIEDVHAQVDITQDILQMLHTSHSHSQAGCATASQLESSVVPPSMQNTSIVTNTMKLMSYSSLRLTCYIDVLYVTFVSATKKNKPCNILGNCSVLMRMQENPQDSVLVMHHINAVLYSVCVHETAGEMNTCVS